MGGGVRFSFAGGRLWLGTGRSDLVAVWFYDLMWGAAPLVLLVGECSIFRGEWCLFNGVDFQGGFMGGGVRFSFVGSRLWLSTGWSDLVVVRFYDLMWGGASLVWLVCECSIFRGRGCLFSCVGFRFEGRVHGSSFVFALRQRSRERFIVAAVCLWVVMWGAAFVG